MDAAWDCWSTATPLSPHYSSKCLTSPSARPPGPERRALLASQQVPIAPTRHSAGRHCCSDNKSRTPRRTGLGHRGGLTLPRRRELIRCRRRHRGRYARLLLGCGLSAFKSARSWSRDLCLQGPPRAAQRTRCHHPSLSMFRQPRRDRHIPRLKIRVSTQRLRVAAFATGRRHFFIADNASYMASQSSATT